MLNKFKNLLFGLIVLILFSLLLPSYNVSFAKPAGNCNWTLVPNDYCNTTTKKADAGYWCYCDGDNPCPTGYHCDCGWCDKNDCQRPDRIERCGDCEKYQCYCGSPETNLCPEGFSCNKSTGYCHRDKNQCKHENAECVVNSSDHSCCAGLVCVASNSSSENGECKKQESATVTSKAQLQVKEDIKQKLQAQKLKICQQKMHTIQTRSKNLTRHMINQAKVFSKIASRAATFYEEKVEPKGKTLEDYDELVSDIDTKKELIHSLLENTEDVAGQFSCDIDNPVATLNRFKEQTKEGISAMKEYKSAVRKLVVSIKS